MHKRKWHPASKFPTPGVKLLVKNPDGEHEAIRPNYAASYQADPDFRSLTDNSKLKKVSEWSIL